MTDIWGPKARHLIEQARITNRERDADEREAGFLAESDCPPADRLRTVLLALNCGIETEDWAAVAEAAVMVEETEMAIEEASALWARERRRYGPKPSN